jgi:DNA-binding XRE family transcriptional regulator
MQISMRAARINAGMKQKDVAKLVGVSVATIGSWENGRSFPTYKRFLSLCHLYGLEQDQIFCENGSIKANIPR